MMSNEIRKLQFQFIAYLSVIIVLSSMSIFSTLGTFAMFTEKSTKSGEVYNVLMAQKMKILDTMNCVTLSESQIRAKQEALDAMLIESTTNFRGARAGSLGSISNNCTSNNWQFEKPLRRVFSG